MSTIDSKKYTLIDLFRDTEGGGEALSCIEIPLIQRDYAQGRDVPKVNSIRERFLGALRKALTNNEPITLDFVYGEIDNNRMLIPLDGQQRLTTLFLLHWYIARHEGVSEDKLAFLTKFSYATRYSAREFCKHLVSPNYQPDFSHNKLSDDIADQCWMQLDWKNDPTISAMLRMIDSIHVKFRSYTDLWQRLEAGCISFYFLPIKELGATDELYIKMNSRGKPLTEFENFKAEWEASIKAIEPNIMSQQEVEQLQHRIEQKLDIDWTDLLWPYRNGKTDSSADDVIDDKFIRYFRFLTDIIFYKDDRYVKDTSDILSISEYLFCPNSDNTPRHIEFIERGFDCWKNVDDIEHLFSTYLTTQPTDSDSQKCIVAAPINVFAQACHTYGDVNNGRNRLFPIGRTILLYAFLYYLQHKETINDTQFARRIRIITNLIKQSEYELREDNMPNLLRQTEYILTHGDVEDGYLSFNANQLAEEHEKAVWLQTHAEKAETLCRLENHPLLQGAIRVIGLDHIDFTDRFYSLFACDHSLVNRALLSIGDYALLVNSLFQIGSGSTQFDSSWRAIFSTNQQGIAPKRDILLALLSQSQHFTNDILQSIIDKYLDETREYDWRHYLVRYDAMRPERYGMYFWEEDPLHEKRGYTILMMLTEKSMGGRNYNIFLKALYDWLLSDDPSLSISLGEYAYSGDGSVLKLTFADKYLYFTDNKLCICHQIQDEQGHLTEIIDLEKPISQTEQGIDLEDRVKLAYDVVKSMIGN